MYVSVYGSNLLLLFFLSPKTDEFAVLCYNTYSQAFENSDNFQIGLGETYLCNGACFVSFEFLTCLAIVVKSEIQCKSMYLQLQGVPEFFIPKNVNFNIFDRKAERFKNILSNLLYYTILLASRKIYNHKK